MSLRQGPNTFSLPKRNIYAKWQTVDMLHFRAPDTSIYYEIRKIRKQETAWNEYRRGLGPLEINVGTSFFSFFYRILRKKSEF